MTGRSDIKPADRTNPRKLRHAERMPTRHPLSCTGPDAPTPDGLARDFSREVVCNGKARKVLTFGIGQ